MVVVVVENHFSEPYKLLDELNLGNESESEMNSKMKLINDSNSFSIRRKSQLNRHTKVTVL